MATRQVPSGLQQFVDDEMLRAPMLFDQVIEGTLNHARKGLPEMAPLQRSAFSELIQAMLTQRSRLADYFTRSLREQVASELSRNDPSILGAGSVRHEADKPQALALVDDEMVALDVELSHAIAAIKGVAEYELRELQAFTSALVGDMDVAADHNPFHPEVYARALWAAAQALPLSRGHQVIFMRQAGAPLAQLLRKTYAAATSRLESMGVEPASYRTLILPAGSRTGYRRQASTFMPDLHRIRDSLAAPLDEAPPQAGASGAAARHEDMNKVARDSTSQRGRQSIELVSRLFEAMLADERVPADVSQLISRLHGPAMRLTLRDDSPLDQDDHPLWRFINRLAFEAEMVPDTRDPERAQLLRQALGVVDQLAAEPEQNEGLYRWALERLEAILDKRLARRLAAAETQIGALQKLEDRLLSNQARPTTLFGMLDVPHLDTVPAELLDHTPPTDNAAAVTDAWLESLRPGDWVRMFLQGRWVQARLLWPGERGEIWLFGDGASDATWAVRRSALQVMRTERLAKTLLQRSVVASAAARVQEQVNDAS